MDLDQIRGFLETARERSFTRAAQNLYLTQPAVSLQVKALETELGQRLFERQGKRVLLTEAGEIMYRRAEEILALVDRVGEDLSALGQLRRGHLHVAASDTLCAYVLPPVIQALRARYPGLDINLTDRMSPDVAALVVEGTVDVGLATAPVRASGVTSDVLFHRKDVAICAIDHPLAGQSRVTVKRLGQEPLLMLTARSTSRALADRLFSEANVRPNVAMELESIEVIKRYVEIGMGVAIVPEVAVKMEARDKRLGVVPVTGLPDREVVVVRRGGHVSAAVQAFLDTLREHLAENAT